MATLLARRHISGTENQNSFSITPSSLPGVLNLHSVTDGPLRGLFWQIHFSCPPPQEGPCLAQWCPIWRRGEVQALWCPLPSLKVFIRNRLRTLPQGATKALSTFPANRHFDVLLFKASLKKKKADVPSHSNNTLPTFGWKSTLHQALSQPLFDLNE